MSNIVFESWWLFYLLLITRCYYFKITQNSIIRPSTFVIVSESSPLSICSYSRQRQAVTSPIAAIPSTSEGCERVSAALPWRRPIRRSLGAACDRQKKPPTMERGRGRGQIGRTGRQPAPAGRRDAKANLRNKLTDCETGNQRCVTALTAIWSNTNWFRQRC